MDQLNQVAQNLVDILSEWKAENDKYKQSIDQLQTGLNAQIASLEILINSNSATSGKRSLPGSSKDTETAVPSKRIKGNEGKVVDAVVKNGYPQPFVMLPLINIKKEKAQMNNPKAGKLAPPTGASNVNKAPSNTVKVPIRITRATSQTALNNLGPEAKLTVQVTVQSPITDVNPAPRPSILTSTPKAAKTKKVLIPKKATPKKATKKTTPIAKAPGRVLTRRASKL